jgi:glycerophosphoryl diester phosphodiesterase
MLISRPSLVLLSLSACKAPDLVTCDSACSDTSADVVEDSGPWNPLVLGHRGSGSNDDTNPLAENTLRSLQQALVQGADGVEIDVHQTSDGVLVLMHDELLDQSTTCAGCVVSSSAEQLRDCQALSGTGESEPIPSLEEVLVALPDAFINIEIKSPESCLGSYETSTAYVEASAQLAANLVGVLGASERVQISSFDRAAIRVVEDVDRTLHTALVWSTGEVSQAIQDALWAGADTLNGHGLVVHEGVASPIEEAGLGMWLWGIELSSDVTRVSVWEPGAMITDHPGVVRQTLIDMGLE